MPIKLFKNARTNKIFLYILLIALIIASAILVSLIIQYYISLEDIGGG